ncbi:MAG TPA: hypothetical protein VG168_14060 [Bryobacteraceae bacterium]|nr:hypothetical protein [Bryobacteraceae bacterium]
MSLTQPPESPTPKHRSSPLRAILPYTTVLLILAMLYVAWTFYSRYQYNREAVKAAAEKKAEREQETNARIFGSGEVRITQFYAETGLLKHGQATQVCYGVVNATSVTMDPSVGEALKPSWGHCSDIAPKKTTTYTITAADAAGHKKTASLTIQVR